MLEVSTPVLLAVLALAVARATRLWRDDTITEPVRARVLDWLDNRKRGSGFWQWWAYLLECPWCLSGWFAIIALALVDSATSRSVPLPVASWLAIWWAACFAYWLLELVSDADQYLWRLGGSKGYWE